VTLTSKERAELRAHANRLPVMVHIGHHGLTDALRKTLDETLRTRELVKIQFSKNADAKAKDVANDLAASLGADVVQTIGRTATLFRLNPELEQKRRARVREEAP
jgi:RNA-binding protein